MGQLEQANKKRGSSPAHMREIGKRTRWQKGRSGNPLGRMPEDPVSHRLKEILSNPKTLERYSRAAIRKATAGHPKFWEMVADRVEGKVPSQMDLQATVIHTITEVDRKNALAAIESIRALESSASNPLIAEIVEQSHSRVYQAFEMGDATKRP
jgi:hypothetical protein